MVIFGSVPSASLGRNQGSWSDTALSSPRRPMSCMASAVAATSGLVTEAMRKIASGGIGVPASRSSQPCALRYMMSPSRATMVTAPTMALRDRASSMTVSTRSSRSMNQATAKLVPQPQEATAFGFLIWNDWPMRSSM